MEMEQKRVKTMNACWKASAHPYSFWMCRYTCQVRHDHIYQKAQTELKSTKHDKKWS